METPSSTTLAEEYVVLSSEIKRAATTLASMRKELKTLDATLLEVMKQENVMSVSAQGVTFERTTKLQIK